MATSGVTTWQLDADHIIKAALRKIAVISKGQTIETADTTAALEALNAMLKSFQVKGMPLWAVKEYTFPVSSTRTYTIGVTGVLATPAPLKIIQAYIWDTVAMSSVPLEIMTHYDYNVSQPVSTTTSSPVQLEYEPGNQIGTIHVWPTPDAYSIANKKITIVYQRPFEDVVATTDNIDFPQFWTEAVIYGLAWRLAPEYGVPLPDRKELEKEAAYHLTEAMSFGTEEGSIRFVPRRDGK